MTEGRFFPEAKSFTLLELSKKLSIELPNQGLQSLSFDNIAPLREAGPSDISFLENTKYISDFEQTKAGLVFCKDRFVSKAPRNCTTWSVSKPYDVYACVAAILYPTSMVPAAILKSLREPSSRKEAIIENGALIEENVALGEGVQIGSGSKISSGAVIGANVKIGRNCSIGSNCVIQHTLIGNEVIIHPGVCSGQDGFGFAMGPSGHLKVPQIGRVIIQDSVEIGANTTIDRGTNTDTVIGQGTKIDNGVQIGHNAKIGQHCILVAHVAISGSTVLEDFVALGGQVAVGGHITLGKGAQIAATSAVNDDVPPGARWGGVPAKPVRDWFKEIALLKQMSKKDLSGLLALIEDR